MHGPGPILVANSAERTGHAQKPKKKTKQQKKEVILRDAFSFLRDGTLPPNSRVGRAKARANAKFRSRVKANKLELVIDGGAEVLVKQPDFRRVLWAEERFQAVEDIHKGEGHYPGSCEKTRVKVQERYWFPQMTVFVSEMVKRCHLCQFEKAGKAPRSDRDIHPTPPTAPFYRVHVDTAGRFQPSGSEQFRYVGVAIDSVTRWIEMWPLKTDQAPVMTQNFLREVLHRHAGVFEVVTDNGGEFSTVFQQKFKEWHLNHVPIAANSPQANGQVERYMQVIKACLRKCAHEHPDSWHQHLSGGAVDIRTTFQDTIQMSPFQCLYGRSPLLPIEINSLPTRHGLVRTNLNRPETEAERQQSIDNIHQAQSSAKAMILGASIVQRKNFARWNATAKNKVALLKKGDWVLMKRPGTIRGLRLRWEGPYAFLGWLPGLKNKKAVLQDHLGQKWFRYAHELCRYIPRIQFVREYLEEVRAVDGVRPMPNLLIARFLERNFVAPPFASLRLEQAITKVRKLHGFVPLRRSSAQ